MQAVCTRSIFFIGVVAIICSLSGAGSEERLQPNSDPRVTADTSSEASAKTRSTSRATCKPITIQRAKLTRGKLDEWQLYETPYAGGNETRENNVIACVTIYFLFKRW